MPIHLYNLLLRSFVAIPTALGSTWLGLFFPLWVFLISQFVILLADGLAKMKTHWKQNLIRGSAAAAAAWASLFLWCLVDTTYKDHQALNVRISALSQTLRSEDAKNTSEVQAIRQDLGGQLAAVKESCAKTEGANEVLSKQASDQQGTINNCQTNALKLLAPAPERIEAVKSADEEFGSYRPGARRAEFILLTNRVLTPVSLKFQCTQTVLNADFIPAALPHGVFGGQVYPTIHDHGGSTRYDSPAFTPDLPVVSYVFYSGGDSIDCTFEKN